jgi:hypothetical protein
VSLPFKPYVDSRTRAPVGMLACIAIEHHVSTGDLEVGVYDAATSLALDRSQANRDGHADHRDYGDELIGQCIDEVGRGAVEKAIRSSLWHMGMSWQEASHFQDAEQHLLDRAAEHARELFPEAYDD